MSGRLDYGSQGAFATVVSEHCRDVIAEDGVPVQRGPRHTRYSGYVKVSLVRKSRMPNHIFQNEAIQFKLSNMGETVRRSFKNLQPTSGFIRSRDSRQKSQKNFLKSFTVVITCFCIILCLDVSIDTVQKFLEFLYTGSIRLETQEQFREVQEFGCDLLGFFNLPETKVVSQSNFI